VIESRNEILSLENLKIKLIEEEARQSDQSTKSDINDSALSTKNCSNRKQIEVNSNQNNIKTKVNKFNGKCFNCDENGHISRFCRLKPK